jgi:outer membrane protein OmpU
MPDQPAIPRRGALGAAALAGALLASGWAGAAEVGPGGALGIEVGGEIKWIATSGDLDEALLDDEVSTGLDFFSDAEIVLEVGGVHDASGLEYGALIELQGSTAEVENTGETWLYLRGGWGQVRLGDDDGVSAFGAGIVAGDEGAALSAANVAAGTGGLDAEVVDDLFGAPTYEPLGTEEVTKISYVTPKFGGLNVGASYTPNLAELGEGEGKGDTLALKNVAAGDVVEAIAHYGGEVAGLAVRASLSGLYGEVENEGLAGGDDYRAAQAGVVVEAFGVSLAGSYLTEEVGALELDAVTLGVGAGFGGDDEEDVGGLNVSLNYGQIIRSRNLVAEDAELGEPYALVLSADYGLMPGLVLQGDVARFDSDYEDGGPGDGEGWVGVAGLVLEF